MNNAAARTDASKTGAPELMKDKLMKRLLWGWTSPIDALRDCGCFSLAQRVSEWRAERRWCAKIPGQRYTKPPPEIIDEWLKLPNGKRVKRYRAVR